MKKSQIYGTNIGPIISLKLSRLHNQLLLTTFCITYRNPLSCLGARLISMHSFILLSLDGSVF